MKKVVPATFPQNSTRSDVQKLYRHVQQISQRLDLQLQQANDWKEWFDVETLQLRQRIRDVCEHILLSGEHDIARKTEEYLWRKAFYDIIQKLKSDRKSLNTKTVLHSVYASHLQVAIGFYHHLLISLRTRYNIPLTGIVDWIGTSSQVDTLPGVTKEQSDWAYKACQRCLIYLGDIARYQLDVVPEANETLAERYYHLAIILNPENGMPHNQLGTLKQNQTMLCQSSYHYMRCILSSTKFDGAEENLKRVLEKHNHNASAMQEESLQTNVLIDMKTQFTTSFLSLQEVLFGMRVISTEELAHWCQSTLSLFGLVLNEGLPKETPLTNGNIADGSVTMHDDSENMLSSGELVKMLGMNIMDVVKLKSNGSEITSAATAFTAALLSQLLEFISKYMKITFPSKTNPQQISSIDQRDEFMKMKKRLLLNKRKRKRRRRLSSHSSDHTESDEDLDFSDDLSDLSEGEMDKDLNEDEDFSEDDESDSVIEELSDKDDENDLEVARLINPEDVKPLKNGMVTHQTRKKLSSLSKAAILLNKQLKHKNSKMHLKSTTNGVIHDFVMDDVEFINEAAKLLDDFEKINEEAFLPSIKVLFDWMKLNPDVLMITGKASPMLWQRLAEVLNYLPSQKVLQTAVMYFSRRRRLPLWLSGELDEGLNHLQKRALPEDMALYGAPGFEEHHHSLDITWFRGLNHSELYQFALRVTYLRNFGHFVSKSQDVPSFSWNDETHQFTVTSDGIADIEAARLSPKNKVVEQRNQMMKALAKQKLKHDVNQLEKQLKSNHISPANATSVYLVLDAPALCRHLSLLRSLVKSAQFVVIVPTQVIAALDELKKYNPGARDAIKFLEDEIKHGNRWLKTQKEYESVTDQTIMINRKKKNRDVEEWRFLQVVKCCVYFVEKHEGESLVTLLTSDSSLQGGGNGGSGGAVGGGASRAANMGTRPSPQALEICKSKSIRVEPVFDFYKRWTTRNGPS